MWVLARIIFPRKHHADFVISRVDWLKSARLDETESRATDLVVEAYYEKVYMQGL